MVCADKTNIADSSKTSNADIGKTNSANNVTMRQCHNDILTILTEPGIGKVTVQTTTMTSTKPAVGDMDNNNGGAGTPSASTAANCVHANECTMRL